MHKRLTMLACVRVASYKQYIHRSEMKSAVNSFSNCLTGDGRAVHLYWRGRRLLYTSYNKKLSVTISDSVSLSLAWSLNGRCYCQTTNKKHGMTANLPLLKGFLNLEYLRSSVCKSIPQRRPQGPSGPRPPPGSGAPSRWSSSGHPSSLIDWLNCLSLIANVIFYSFRS